MTELQINTKNQVFDMFEDLSSKEKQLVYKSQVPFVHIPNELISEWDGNFIKNKEWYREIWTRNQWKALNEFDVKFIVILNQLPNDIPDVPEVFENEEWQKIISLAYITLEKLKLDI